ncbi:hypothetical protein [Candidatus Lokiarchaeum ossiferum]|uniref:hypothetical protein n=1 Tax=Candidatus Lokiarchaeum ossiferum TaxID=2951803 RepID=UPI00352E67AF
MAEKRSHTPNLISSNNAGLEIKDVVTVDIAHPSKKGTPTKKNKKKIKLVTKLVNFTKRGDSERLDASFVGLDTFLVGNMMCRKPQ